MPVQLASVFHIHTSHSFDCLTSPAKAVRWAKRHDVGVLAITDHDTIRGAQEAADTASGSGVQVIIGAEYATNHGDIIGLFLRDEISSRDAFEVIAAIKKQGGLSVLPHPYHGHTLTEQLAESVDMVEVFNARCSDKQNRQALELARSRNKPMIAGSDSHFSRDIGRCICYLDATPAITAESLLRAQLVWDGKQSPRTGVCWSQVIKGLKTRNPVLIASQLRALCLAYVRNAIGERLYASVRHVWKKQPSSP